MTIRRIFASSIVALLLSAPSLAAACDLSCAFAPMNSDCHSQQADSQGSASGDMKMDGMAMAGMAMPEMASDEDQQSVSAVPGAKTGHPLIGEMGLCEKQACDGGSAVSTRKTASTDSHFHFTLADPETPRSDIALPLFRDARDDVAYHYSSNGSPLHLTLRI